MRDAPATDFRPVILGGDITAYSLVRTFHAAYRVRPLVVNMTDGGPIAMSTLCDHIHVEGFEKAWASPDVIEAQVARIEKRAPNFFGA